MTVNVRLNVCSDTQRSDKCALAMIVIDVLFCHRMRLLRYAGATLIDPYTVSV